ncbi:hypothetical protein F4818DRAFT_410836 [Hypoxylon cercidicola]|nr:hypothetical protein F4818DRAFT_410836 [Hypoxylon cercidicola]
MMLLFLYVSCVSISSFLILYCPIGLRMFELSSSEYSPPVCLGSRHTIKSTLPDWYSSAIRKVQTCAMAYTHQLSEF